jgi:uncharacterized membrane protein YbhN (UPF0104 family)
MRRAGRNGGPPPSLRGQLLSPQTGLSLLALGGLVALLVWGFDIAWSATYDAVRHLDLRWFAAAVGIHYCTFLFRGARWRVLLGNATRTDAHPPRLPSAVGAGFIILTSWFANSVTWFRMGDAYRAYAYTQDSGFAFTRSIGVVLADRLVDLVVVIVLMGAGMGVLVAGGQVHPPLLLVLVGGGLLSAVVAGLAGMVLAKRWVAPRLPAKVGEVYHRFHDATLGSFRRIPLVFALGVGGWLCEAGRLALVIQAVGVNVALGLVLFVPMANGLLTAVPLTPGGLGVVETGVSGLLRLELAVELAVAVALVDRMISYLSVVLLGGIAFAARQVSVARRTIRRAQDVVEKEER